MGYARGSQPDTMEKTTSNPIDGPTDAISIKITNIKNIHDAFIEMPLQKGINVIVGANGSGKSTILQALSQSFSTRSLPELNRDDYDDTSTVSISLNGATQTWRGQNGWRTKPRAFTINGMYEGSLFYGTRFNDSRLVDALLSDGSLSERDIVDADDYMKETLSYILCGLNGNYSNLKRVRNRNIAKDLGLNNVPYFNKVGGRLISQYRMSSGECLLISLLHFVYNSIVRRSLPKKTFILVLIDEIELALHPIAVHRFLETVEDLVKINENLMVVLTSHSPEVIRKIPPKNIYKIENSSGVVSVVNPGYPSYVIRDVYKHDGFDTLILTEDVLAQRLIQKVIDKNKLCDNRLLHIVPVGGWENVLNLHHDLLQGNVLGIGRGIISVVDGDVKNIFPAKYKHLRHMFLPVESIEKFLSALCKTSGSLKKAIGDKYFTVKSLSELMAEHVAEYPEGAPQEAKKLYRRLLRDLEARKISEDTFIERLSDDILLHVDFRKFTESLRKVLS